MSEALNTTKSDTLLFIRDMVTKSFVEDIVVVSVEDFRKNKDKLLGVIEHEFKGDKIVVRSSFRNDRGDLFSKNGHYESALNVKSDDRAAVETAIMKVMNSYIAGNEELGFDDIPDAQILIQRQATDIAVFGSVHTRDAFFNRPYYVFNYEERKNKFSADSSVSKIKWIARNVSREFLDERFYRLLEAVKEIEALFGGAQILDIEFAIDNMENIIIFQVKEIPEERLRPRALSDHEFYDTKSFAKCSYLDEYHVLSDMACFGLTENLGTNPRPLDFSLYRELVTNSVWSESINMLGYAKAERDIMLKIGNKPYVSVNAAFECLAPADIDEELRYKLNEFYVDKLRKNGHLHDRIEYDIALCAYDFCFEDKLSELWDNGFNGSEIEKLRNSVSSLTRNIVDNYDSIYAEDKQNVDILTRIRRELRKKMPLTENNSMKLYGYVDTLLKAIREYGTPQYVRQNRCALIAECFCRSLVEKGYFPEEEVTGFIASINTVVTDFERDFDLYSHNKMSLAEFDSMYGHLRLGAFDIRTESYRKMYGDMQGKSISGSILPTYDSIKYLDEKILKNALHNTGLPYSVEAFNSFIVKSLQNMELFRFECIKSLGLILQIITRLGETMGIAKEDMSYLEINDLISYHSREAYIQDILSRRDMYHANIYLMLPEVIFGVGDIDVINQSDAYSAYITDKIIDAEVIDIKDDEMSDIDGKIVALSSVNSGYNWIFTRNIAGFIAKHGTTDSPMAKRCRAMGIPALIGCGEKIYGRVVRMNRIRLDCKNKRVVEL